MLNVQVCEPKLDGLGGRASALVSTVVGVLEADGFESHADDLELGGHVGAHELHGLDGQAGALEPADSTTIDSSTTSVSVSQHTSRVHGDDATVSVDV